MLTEDDKHWIAELVHSQLEASERRMTERIEATESRMAERIEATETRLLTEFHKWASPH